MDVARRARAATAAQSEQFIKSGVADDFHDGQAFLTLNFLLGAVGRHNYQLCHALSS